MKNPLKIFLFFLTSFVFGILVLLYIINEKLNPDSIVQNFTNQIERNFYGSKASYRKKSYFIGLDFVLEIDDLTLIKEKKPLAEIKKLEMRFPLWAFFIEQSRVKLSLEQVKLFTWDKHLNYSNQIDKSIKFEFPGYLNNSHINLKIKNFSLINFEKNKEILSVDKFLLRDFSSRKKSSFELVLPVKKIDNLLNEENQVWLFGEIKPSNLDWNFNFWGEIKPSEPRDDTLDVISFNGMSFFTNSIVQLKSELVFFLNKKKLGLGNILVAPEKTSVHFEFADFPMARLEKFKTLIGNNHLSDLVSQGRIVFDFNKKENDSSAILRGEIDFLGDYLLVPGKEVYPGKWRVLIKNNKVESSFINPKGDISFFKRSVINLDTLNIEQFSEEIGYTDLDLANSLFDVKSVFQLISSLNKNYFSTTYSLKNLKFNNLIYNGFVKIGAVPDSTFYSLQLDNKDSLLKINYQRNNSINKLNLISKNFSWDSKNNFLNPLFMADQALLNGTVEGEWQDDFLKGIWDVKINSTQLLSPSGLWMNFLSRVWNIFEIDPNIYPKQSWNFTFRSGLLKLRSLALEGMKPLQIRGNLNLIKEDKSYLVLRPLKGNSFKPVIKPILNFTLEENNEP